MAQIRPWGCHLRTAKVLPPAAAISRQPNLGLLLSNQGSCHDAQRFVENGFSLTCTCKGTPIDAGSLVDVKVLVDCMSVGRADELAAAMAAAAEATLPEDGNLQEQQRFATSGGTASQCAC